jgi:DNA-binding LytR/AlgR family response regulator
MRRVFMRIKVNTKDKKADIKKISEKDFLIVEENETHLLIDSFEYNITGKTGSRIKPFNPSDVLYAESYGNDVFVHTMNDKLKIDKRLYEFLDTYQELGFIQINKSYIVNINYIVTIYPLINMRYIIKMTNSDELFVTRTYLKAFKERIKGGNHGRL